MRSKMDAAAAVVAAAEAAVTMPRARKTLDKHRDFINSNPQLFGWSWLALPDDKTKAYVSFDYIHLSLIAR